MVIYKATKDDLDTLACLAIILWFEHTIEDLKNQFASIINSSDAAFYIVTNEGQPIGFAQCQLRHDYVEGTESSPVGYLEGVFVKAEYRKRGIGKKLIHQCEEWAENKGCREFASDCELNNTDSLKLHLRLGFEEANRIICFKKNL